jgi:aldehyde dehydrogenase (NAD+)
MQKDFLRKLGLKTKNAGTWTGQEHLTGSARSLHSHSPVDGEHIGSVTVTTREQYEQVISSAEAAFRIWRDMPAPKRGEIVRQYGEVLRQYKDPLGRLVSYEMGKSLQEGFGEVQEMIDICDFAVGLSRQLYGLTMHSERPGHRMYEQWHPLGIVGIISAFNFPVAVWSWNACIAWVCGDVCVWKPSEKTPLCAIACQNLFQKVLKANNLPEGIILHHQRRLQGGRVHDQRQPRTARERHRQHPHGQDRGPHRSRTFGPQSARTGRQQRHHHHAFRRYENGADRRRVRRRGHRRPALHQHPPAHHPRERV